MNLRAHSLNSYVRSRRYVVFKLAWICLKFHGICVTDRITGDFLFVLTFYVDIVASIPFQDSVKSRPKRSVNEYRNYKRRKGHEFAFIFLGYRAFQSTPRNRSQFANNLHESPGNFSQLRGKVVRSINHTTWEGKKEPAANFPRKRDGARCPRNKVLPRVLESFRLITIKTTIRHTEL